MRTTPRRIAVAAVFAGLVAAALPATAASAATAATLTADHTTVNAGQAVTFTVTEPSATGPATFYVHAKAGWTKVSTAPLSAAGSASFTFHPTVTHAYRVTLADGVTTPNVTVKVDIGPRIVAAAAAQKGKPYRFGAAGPHSFDCSGLTKYVFAKFGITLPHKADEQLHHGKAVSAANRKPGDLVFVVSGGHASHVAIYAGHGKWWEAPHTGANVRLVKIWSSHVVYRRVR